MRSLFCRCLAALSLAVLAPGFASAGPSVDGQWSPVINLPIVPTSGALLPDGNLMLWAADGEFSYAMNGISKTVLFNPNTQSFVFRTFTENNHNMFCTGTTQLADGRILVNGGMQMSRTTIYDPLTGQWRPGASMNIPRGYNANTILQDGAVLTLGGSWSGGYDGLFHNKHGEVWTEATGWQLKPGVLASYFEWEDKKSTYGFDSHMSLFQSGDGRVFYAGPSPKMKWIDLEGQGSVSDADGRGDDVFAINSTVVMYEQGKLLKAGGADGYAGATSSTAAYDIDITNGVRVRKLSPMIYARGYHNGVVLPDGKVFVIGGQTYVANFRDSDAVLATEVWDPKTRRFQTTAPISVPRNYHSIALLLPDGRVLSGGGGLCGTCTTNHPDVQIYSPGYLFDEAGQPAVRPAITGGPTTLSLGVPVAVATDSPVVAFSLVRFGSATHTVDNDQRRLNLDFTQVGPTSYSLKLPSNPGWLTPGNWMLFAMNDKGVPSVAKIVRVLPNTIAKLVSPHLLQAKVGQPLEIPANVSNFTKPLTFSATGLPPGFDINPATGTISGTPQAPGAFRVSLSASDGVGAVSTEFSISVEALPGNGQSLLATYYNSTNLEGAIDFKRLEAPGFDLAGVSPGGTLPGVNYSVRWSGRVLPTQDGPTTFRIKTDGGVRLWVDGQLLIDVWSVRIPSEYIGEINLTAGKKVQIVLEYFSGVSIYGPVSKGLVSLAWRRSGEDVYSNIPAAQLFPPLDREAGNFARGKTAVQSSTVGGGVAGRAVDGNTNGVFSNLSVVHTSGTSKEDWWQVDLGSSQNIDAVRLWNRTDCCQSRLRDFYVLVSDSDLGARTLADIVADPNVTKRYISANTAIITSSMSIPIKASGRFVRVQLNKTDALNLAEVEVFVPGANSAPIVRGASAQVEMQGAAVSYQIDAVDPDGDPLLYDATGLPDGLTVNAATGVVSGVLEKVGTFHALLSATDPGDLRGSSNTTWYVMGGAPSVASLAAPPVRVGETAIYAPTIQNGEGVTYRWNFGDGSAATAFSSSPDISHVFSAIGSYNVTLLMRSPDGGEASYSMLQAVVSGSVASQSRRAASGTAFEPASSWPARIWSVNPDTDSVGAVEISSGLRKAEVVVGKEPVAAAFAPSGKLWVVNRGSATVSVVNPRSGEVLKTFDLPRGSQPAGMVISPTDGTAYISLEATGEIARLSSTGAILSRSPLAPSVRGISWDGNGRLLVSRFVTPPLPGESTANVQTVDASGRPVGGQVLRVRTDGAIDQTIVLSHSDVTDTEASGRGIPNYVGAAAVSPDGKTAWVPSKQDNVKRGAMRDGRPLDFQNSVRAVLSRIDLTTGLEDLSSRIDFDNAGQATAAVYHPSGAYVFVALGPTRQVAVVDPVGKRELFRIPVERAPSSLEVTPDGAWLLVSNFMSRSVSVIDITPLVNFGKREALVLYNSRTINSTSEKLSANVLRGKQLFYDAADTRLARDGYLSCAVCHDGGRGDGRVWDFTGFGEGLRNTISLIGHGGISQGFLHWSANFDEVQDFETQIRNFAGGAGLMSDSFYFSGDRNTPFKGKKTGWSSELDALSAYVSSLTITPPSPYRLPTGFMSDLALQGSLRFIDSGCGACHGGPALTSSATLSAVRDIGTIKSSSGFRLGGPLTGIDPPTLRDLNATSPYLHDGSAPTIEAAIVAHRNISLPQSTVAAIVQYLREVE